MAHQNLACRQGHTDMAAMFSLLELAQAPGGQDSAALSPLKTEAQAALQGGLDWPNPKSAAWRNTRLTGLGDDAWQLLEGGAGALDAEIQLPPLPLGHHRFVIVDGTPAWGLCQLPLADSGTYVADLCEGLTARPELAAHLDTFGLRQQDAFAALNAARTHHGALVHVAAKGPKVAPLEIVFVSTGKHERALVQPRVLVVVDAQAEADIIETHVGLSEAASWTNAVTDLSVGRSAHLRYAVYQEEGPRTHHLATVAANVQADGHLHLLTMDRGSLLGRRHLQVALAEQGAEASLNHVVLARAQQHLDTHALVRHMAPHTHCNQSFRAVLDGHSTAIFDGMIDIVPQAQKITAKQMSRSLLVSPGAQAVIKPQMVILADDVKCAHGATIGQLDEDAYFYLLSRGIDSPTARQMLTFAFLAEAVQDVPQTLRTPLMARMCHWLGVDAAISMPLSLPQN